MEFTQETVGILLTVISVILAVLVGMTVVILASIKDNYLSLYQELRGLRHIVENTYAPSKEEIAAEKADKKESEDLNKEAQNMGKGY